MELKNVILETLDEVSRGREEVQRDEMFRVEDIEEGTIESLIYNAEQNGYYGMLKQESLKKASVLNEHLSRNAGMATKTPLQSPLHSSSHSSNITDNRISRPIINSRIHRRINNASVPNTPIDVGDMDFLKNLREKLLVLFEGLQITELQDSQKKLNLVINFLQYQLCLIEEYLNQNN